MEQTVYAFEHVAALPAPHAGFGLARSAHDFHGAVTVCAFENDTCTPDVFLFGVSVGDNGFKTLLSLSKDEGWSSRPTVKATPVRMMWDSRAVNGNLRVFCRDGFLPLGDKGNSLEFLLSRTNH